MSQPIEVARVRMTTLEAQRRLSFPDYVKVILGKTDGEKARQRVEREHEMAAKRFENQRLSEQAQLHA